MTISTKHATEPVGYEDYARALAAGENLARLRGVDDATMGFLRNLAVARFAQGDVKGATESFLHLCVHRHDDPDLWLGLARSASAAGRRGTARAAYGVAFALRPGTGLALEIARASLAAGDRAQAARDVKGWIGAYIAARGDADARARFAAIAALTPALDDEESTQ